MGSSSRQPFAIPLRQGRGRGEASDSIKSEIGFVSDDHLINVASPHVVNGSPICAYSVDLLPVVINDTFPIEEIDLGQRYFIAP
jgi:hypothetical protein